MTERKTATSFAWQRPEFQRQAPDSLRDQGSMQGPFGRAHLPANDTKRDAFNAVDERQGETGSRMVKRDKPFPELRPKHALLQIRQRFNQDWRDEYKRAQERTQQGPDNALTREATPRAREKGLER